MSRLLCRPCKREDLIDKTAIICPSLTIYKLFKDALSKIDKLETKKTIADAITVEVSKDFCLIGPVLGAPASAIVIEHLVVSGVKDLFFLGLAGGLSSSNHQLNIGDLVFPRGAISEEGTTTLYGASEQIEFVLSQRQRNLEKSFPNADSGLIWTTDAPYRENLEKVKKYSAKGAVAVEMEFSVLAHLAVQNQLDLVAAFVISDLLSETWQQGFSKKEVKESLRAVVDAFLVIPTQ